VVILLWKVKNVVRVVWEFAEEVAQGCDAAGLAAGD